MISRRAFLAALPVAVVAAKMVPQAEPCTVAEHKGQLFVCDGDGELLSYTEPLARNCWESLKTGIW